jgi:hypothetical protein
MRQDEGSAPIARNDRNDIWKEPGERAMNGHSLARKASMATSDTAEGATAQSMMRMKNV